MAISTNNQDDDEFIDTIEARRAPPELRFLRYEDYGSERWPVRGIMSAGSIESAFVDVRNPLERAAIVDINLGVDPQLHMALERLRPKSEQLDENTVRSRFHKHQALRAEYVRVRLEWSAGGVIRIPREWVAALRRVRNGYVVSGLAPFVELVGEENPPLHAALYDPEPVPSAPRRRSAKP
jgi:hypothetical protein